MCLQLWLSGSLKRWLSRLRKAKSHNRWRFPNPRPCPSLGPTCCYYFKAPSGIEPTKEKMRPLPAHLCHLCPTFPAWKHSVELQIFLGHQWFVSTTVLQASWRLNRSFLFRASVSCTFFSWVALPSSHHVSDGKQRESRASHTSCVTHEPRLPEHGNGGPELTLRLEISRIQLNAGSSNDSGAKSWHRWEKAFKQTRSLD